jgi:hypothetical protein
MNTRRIGPFIAASKLVFHRRSDKIGSIFVSLEHLFYMGERTLREPGYSEFNKSLFSSHAAFKWVDFPRRKDIPYSS